MWYSTFDIWLIWNSVFGAQFRFGGRAVLQVLVLHRLLEHLQARELQQVGGVGGRVEAVVGLVADDLGANQVVERVGHLARAGPRPACR